MFGGDPFPLVQDLVTANRIATEHGGHAEVGHAFEGYLRVGLT
jgi:hypothetical protein